MTGREIQAVADVTARDRILINASRGGGAMEGLPDKLAALRDVSHALETLRAPFALVGGVAVGIRSGVPRATQDTDVAVDSTVDRESLIDALSRAGLALRGRFAHTLNFRHTTGEPVQLVLDPAFDAMIARAEPISVIGTMVPVVTTADLITMKERAAADPARRRSKALRDAADAALLRGDIPDPDEGW